MGATLMLQRRVEDEGLRIVNFCQQGGRHTGVLHTGLMVLEEEGLANSVPAAAVIRRSRALVGITGRKASVGGVESQG